MRAIVTGMIASYPVGGVVWDYGQYALGLERLGLEVYYLEDTGWETYNPVSGAYGPDCAYGVEFLERSLRALSPTLGDRWHFRNLDGRSFGIAASDFEEIVAGADLLVNVSGGTLLRDAYMACPRKLLIDTDPGWNHFRNYPRWDAQPGWQGSHGYRAHDHFFTYAERIGKPGCRLPSLGIDWIPTRPPVVMDCWEGVGPGSKWTTVMTWKNFQEEIRHEGEVYGTKEREFTKIEAIPRQAPASFEVAIGGGEAPIDRWRALGWSVADAQAISVTPDSYRAYVQQSRGEFSVAKNVYVATESGWFSCRTVCYLAAGRPAVVQDTGFSESIRTGEGLFAFSDVAGAARGVAAVEASYEVHREAARELAAREFGSDRVCGELLERIGLG